MFFYKGCVSHKGTVYPGEQVAIVDERAWDRVNRKLLLRSAALTGRKHHKQEALLENLIRCGGCGSILVATYTKRRGRRYSYYICPQSKRQDGCEQPPVAANDLDTSVRERLESMLGAGASTIAIRQAVKQMLYAGRTRQVVVTLQDGSRLEYTLPVPNRGGVRSVHRPPTGKIPRISRLMALAIKMEKSVRTGEVKDYATLAASGPISRPRMSQIMNLMNLAPEIQEWLLFLPRTFQGPDSITERQLRKITQTVDWTRQKELFRELTG